MTGVSNQSGGDWQLDAGAAANHDLAVNPSGIVLACEHAGKVIPMWLNGLGLSDDMANSHIAWDPGAFDLARFMAIELSADLVWQRYSRLVYDCNRPPSSPASIVEYAETMPIPGNIDISNAERQWRIENVYRPFQSMLKTVLVDRVSPVLVTIHSFTPVFRGEHRAVELGILHDKDSRLADALLANKQLRQEFDMRRNEPYAARDGVTHTLVNQTRSENYLNVMIEVRSNLLDTPDKQKTIAKTLATALKNAVKSITETHADLTENAHELP